MVASLTGTVLPVSSRRRNTSTREALVMKLPVDAARTEAAQAQRRRRVPDWLDWKVLELTGLGLGIDCTVQGRAIRHALQTRKCKYRGGRWKPSGLSRQGLLTQASGRPHASMTMSRAAQPQKCSAHAYEAWPSSQPRSCRVKTPGSFGLRGPHSDSQPAWPLSGNHCSCITTSLLHFRRTNACMDGMTFVHVSRIVYSCIMSSFCPLT